MTYTANIPPTQLIAGATITAAQVVQTTNTGKATPVVSNFTITQFAGIALTSGTVGSIIQIQSSGPLNPSVLNLGDGYACAVGINSSGVPVRATDGYCVSPGNWIGTCDGYGNITIKPHHTSELNIVDYGAIVGDSSASARLQNNGAFSAAMKATKLIANFTGGGDNSGAVIKFPSGNYYFAQTIDITRPIHVLGVKGKFFPGVQFIIPDGYIGIHIWDYSGQVGFPDESGVQGTGTVIEGIYLVSETNYAITEGSSVAYGIFMSALAEVSHCVINNFGGHGIYISSENNGFPDNWQIYWTRVTGCQDGVHVVGGDTNVGCCEHGDFQGNRGWGVFDHSFLGCAWISCHTAENACGAYNVYADGGTTLLNCYSESDQVPSQVGGVASVIGGDHGAGFTQTSGFFGGVTANEVQPTGFLGKANGNIPLTGVRIWSPGLTILDGYTIVQVISGTTISVDDYIFQAQNNGTTGATLPAFPSAVGATVNDNGVIWKNVGIQPKISVVAGTAPSNISFTIQVVTDGYPDGYDAFFPYTLQHSQILQIRYTTDNEVTWIYFIPTRADDNYAFGTSHHELGFSNIHTSVASGSNNAVLPQSIINVSTTSGFTSSGTLLLQSSTGLQSITYTGITTGSFTGCTGGSGTINTGNDGYQGGSGTTIYFTPNFYYTDNSWTGSTDAGITTQFTAGSSDGTYSAFSWGHFLNTEEVSPPLINLIDTGSPWRVQYNQTTGRWIQTWANSVVSKEWAGSRSLPFPGTELFDFGLVSSQQSTATGVTDGYGGWNRVGWYDASQVYGSTTWRGLLTPGSEWFHPGTLFFNRAGPGNNYPVATRSTQQGGWSVAAGYGYDIHWSAGLSIRVGDTIYPSSTSNPAYGHIFRANSSGATQSVEPVWPTILGNTVQDGLINWQNVGTLDGYGSNTNTFEPVIVASTLKLTKDCSAGGTITLSFAEISHERYILTGSPGAAFTVIIGVGAGDSWNRVLFNNSSQSVTVAASGGDPGTVVLAGKALHLLHTGTNIIAVSS